MCTYVSTRLTLHVSSPFWFSMGGRYRFGARAAANRSLSHFHSSLLQPKAAKTTVVNAA